ncbi:MAG: hypothetical protein ACI9D1_002664 [Cryomorphaceae bacterium]
MLAQHGKRKKQKQKSKKAFHGKFKIYWHPTSHGPAPSLSDRVEKERDARSSLNLSV